MRAIIPGAASGSSAVCPNSVWPLVTVSRLVPSLSISESRPAWEEAESPSTATIAATPMAIPSADSAGPEPARAQADAGDAREIGEPQSWRLDARGRTHLRGWFTSANAARFEVPFTAAVTM